MTLPIKYSYPPMEAQSVADLPVGREWQYEPKWDGFRCLAFRDGTTVELRSKAGRSLSRYFPEVVAALGALGAKNFVLDGEIVVPEGKTLSFDALLQRIHPAASRVTRLAAETPAMYVVFDLLADERGRSLVDKPLKERRPLLEAFAGKYFNKARGVRLSPRRRSLRVARGVARRSAGLDGVIAKRLDLPYEIGRAHGNAEGEADPHSGLRGRRIPLCVEGGRGWLAAARVCTMTPGMLNHVGFTSSLTAAERKALTPKLEKLISRLDSRGKSRVVRAAGAPSGQRSGNRCRRSSWSKSRTIIFRETAFGTGQASFGGDRTSCRGSARWSRCRNRLRRWRACSVRRCAGPPRAVLNCGRTAASPYSWPMWNSRYT